jgi:hypothetical protein
MHTVQLSLRKISHRVQNEISGVLSVPFTVLVLAEGSEEETTCDRRDGAQIHPLRLLNSIITRGRCDAFFTFSKAFSTGRAFPELPCLIAGCVAVWWFL